MGHNFIFKRMSCKIINCIRHVFNLMVTHFIVPRFKGITGALAVLMKDAIKPTLMQTLEVSLFILSFCEM